MVAVVEKGVVLATELLVGEDTVVEAVAVVVVAVVLQLEVLGLEVGLVKEEVQGMVLEENMGLDMVEVAVVVAVVVVEEV